MFWNSTNSMLPSTEVSAINNSGITRSESIAIPNYSNIHSLEQLTLETVSTPIDSVPGEQTESTRTNESFADNDNNKTTESLPSSLSLSSATLPLPQGESPESTIFSPASPLSQLYHSTTSFGLSMSSSETLEGHTTAQAEINHYNNHHHHFTTSSNTSYSVSETLAYVVSSLPSSLSSLASSSFSTSASSIVEPSNTQFISSDSINSTAVPEQESMQSLHNSSSLSKMSDKSTAFSTPYTPVSHTSITTYGLEHTFSLSESVSLGHSTGSSLEESSMDKNVSSSSRGVETNGTVSTVGESFSSTDKTNGSSVSNLNVDSSLTTGNMSTTEAPGRNERKFDGDDTTVSTSSDYGSKVSFSDTEEMQTPTSQFSSESSSTNGNVSIPESLSELNATPSTILQSFSSSSEISSSYTAEYSYTAKSELNSGLLSLESTALETSHETSIPVGARSEDLPSPSITSDTGLRWTAKSSSSLSIPTNSTTSSVYAFQSRGTYQFSEGTALTQTIYSPTSVSEVAGTTSYDHYTSDSTAYSANRYVYESLSEESSQEEKDHSPVPDTWDVSTNTEYTHDSETNWDSSRYYSQSLLSSGSYNLFAEVSSVGMETETQRAFGINSIFYEASSSELSSYLDTQTLTPEFSTSSRLPHLPATVYPASSAVSSEETDHVTALTDETPGNDDNSKTLSSSTYEVFGPTPVPSSKTTVSADEVRHVSSELSSARASPEPSPSALSPTSPTASPPHTVTTTVSPARSELDTTLSTSTKSHHSLDTAALYLSSLSSSSSPVTETDDDDDEPDFSTSQEDVLIIYTQNYDFTGSSTTFVTGIPSTIKIPKKEFSTLPSETFSVLRSTITADVSLYEKWLNGGNLGNDVTGLTGGDSTDKGTIIGSVIGSVCGVVVCGLIIWAVISRRQKRRGLFGGESDEIRNNFKNDERHFLPKDISRDFSFRPGYHSMFTKKQTINAVEENENPFNNEFDISNRANPPPIPAPRKTRNSALRLGSDMGPTAGVYDSSSGSSSSMGSNFPGQATANRDSYLSSSTGSYDSSSLGSSITDGYSLLSTTPTPAAGVYPSARRNVSSNSQGFLRELI